MLTVVLYTWNYIAKQEVTKIKKMVEAIRKLLMREKFYKKKEEYLFYLSAKKSLFKYGLNSSNGVGKK